MPDLEQNLDAYRILAQILRDFRNSMRTQLEKLHGNEWYRVGLPQMVLDRLIERKEREKAIDWYENEYQELVDFASFEDILEILEANPDLMPELKAVTPSQPLLHARMMELEIMREKLAMARAISETELAFLGTFHLRIRKALETASAKTGQEPTKARPPIQAVPAPAEAPKEVVAEQDPEGAHTRSEPEPDAEDVTTEDKDEEEKRAKRHKMKTRIGRSKTFGGAKVSGPSSAVTQTAIISEEKQGEPEVAVEEAPATSGGNVLAAALDTGDSVTVLRALYKEVTTLAEGLWTSDAPPSPVIWLRVREHRWYEENFSELGLKPLSDFYDILARIHDRMSAGLAKDELQQLLKEHSFAMVLLALRDMFQKNQI